MTWILRTAWAVFLVSCTLADDTSSLKEAKEYLSYLDKEVCQYKNRRQIAYFNLYSDATDENQKILDDVLKTSYDIKVEVYDWESFKDPDILRQATLYSYGGYDVPNEVYEKSSGTYTEMDNIHQNMNEIVDNMLLCNYTNREQCDIKANPDFIFEKFRDGDDPDELKYYWLQYQDKIGKAIKPLYKQYVALGNKYAQFFNYPSKVEQWLIDYDSPTPEQLMKDVLSVNEQIQPLYLQLHAYVRKRLYEYYGPCYVNKTGPIPIHLTGLINAEAFKYVFDKIKPYPNKDYIDITAKMTEQKITPVQMVKICEDYYTSLGLPAMPDSFWKTSMFEKPTDRKTLCDWIEWNMYDKKDYRIMMCSKPTMETLLLTCKKVGRLEYAIACKDQPCCYRDFTLTLGESTGNLAKLSLTTTERLAKLGFLETPTEIDEKQEITQLLYEALEMLVNPPSATIYDLWRWQYFKGEINENNYNKVFWDMRLKFQGIAPPEPRADDILDIATKNFVISDDQCMRFVLSDTSMYQMQRHLCTAAGKYNPSDPASLPLHRCDLYGSKDAGKLLNNMFSLGLSKPWNEAVKEATGDDYLDGSAYMDYFGVLYEWLKAENKRTGEVIGW